MFQDVDRLFELNVLLLLGRLFGTGAGFRRHIRLRTAARGRIGRIGVFLALVLELVVPEVMRQIGLVNLLVLIDLRTLQLQRGERFLRRLDINVRRDTHSLD